MRKTIRKLAGLLVLVLCLSIGVLAMPVSAAGTQNLTDLLTAGTIKPLGRTQVNADGTGITADWSGSGFDVNVSGGGTMTVGYKANYANHWVVMVDGQQVWRGNAEINTAGGTFSVEIPAGAHTVRVVKDTEISSTTSCYSMLTTLTFDGTITGAPAQKDIYIEFIGDSYSCGDGSLATFTPGHMDWSNPFHSATHAFTYLTAQELDADYSIVAKGGIGMFVGISEQEGTAQKKGMQDIYGYVSGYYQDNGTYSFARQPDVVVVELGANDTISADDQYKTIEYWTGLMKTFISEQVRVKNPDAQIVLTSHDATKYKAMMDVVTALQEEDPEKYAKLHTFFYDFLGNGSGARTTQYAGHLSVEDNIHFADALASFIRSEDLIPAEEQTATYNDITYFVSESGDDSNDGKAISTAKKTVNAVFTQAKADNGDSTSFAAGTRIVIYVDGTVLTNSANSQVIGGTELFLETGGTVRDHIPIVLTTYNYSGTRATIQINHTTAINDGNASVRVCNDLEFRDIALYSTTDAETGYTPHRLYASGCHLIFDNASLTTDGLATATTEDNTKWIVAADRFSSGGFTTVEQNETLYGTITFRNGDYTNLNFVTAVNANSISSNSVTYTEQSGLHCKVVIEDGAQMGTVIGRYGTMTVGSAEVEINGGSVAQYVGTADGESTSEHKTYVGNVNLTITGGHIGGTHFSTAGQYVTIDGDINTTITGGIFSITPRQDKYDAYFFGGRRNCIVDNINTTISGGQFYLLFDVADVDSGYYFGVSDYGTVRNVTNKISCGAFLPMARGANAKQCSIFLGNYTGAITGTLRNEITGGNFVVSKGGASDQGIYFGTRGVNQPIGKIINVIGAEGSTHGPTFVGGIVRMAGGWAQVGTSTGLSAMPDVTECTDTVVVSNTIYGGEFNLALNMGATGTPNATSGYRSFIKGSIENNIYGGFFKQPVFGAGNGPVYGHVTTNIYGGHFTFIFGGSSDGAAVYDGVELNIYGMEEYYPISTSSSNWNICAGNRKGGNVPAPQTAGRDSIRLTVAPPEGTELKLNTKLTTGTANGTVSAAVSGGKFRLDPTALLAKDDAYCVESITEGTLNYRVVKGYRNAGAFIDFGSSLDFALYLQADNAYAGAGYTCTISQNKEGKATALTADNVSVEPGTGHLAGKLIVTAHGIAAKEMRDDITFTISKGGETYLTETLSIYDAVKAWYDGTSGRIYKTMLADMLNYGRAAQAVFDYNEDNMGEELTTSTQPDWGTADSTHGVDSGYEDKVLTTLSLKEQVELNVYVDDVKATVSNVTFIPEGKTEGTQLTENTDYFVEEVQIADGETITRIKFSEINVVDAKGLISFTVSLSSGESFEMKYGIKDYVVRALMDPENTQSDLLVALQKYVDSVCAYLASQGGVSWITYTGLADETMPIGIAAVVLSE